MIGGLVYMIYSPLRYPGGKGRLSSFMEVLIKKTGHINGTYIEPFAGGAGIAINLLLNNYVSKIVINDLDKGIYSFWRAILTETDRFISDIISVPLSMDEWHRQRAIYMEKSQKYSYDLGFATFYLNRTNRSGIIKGGVIGGKNQSGRWKMDARFNKNTLIQRIQEIVKRKNGIHVYNKDINSFLIHYAPKYFNNALIYFDPPYYTKGHELYMNFFRYTDHVRISERISQLNDVDWIITYDIRDEILELYREWECRRLAWSYSAGTQKKVDEIMIFCRNDMIPTESELSTYEGQTLLRDIID